MKQLAEQGFKYKRAFRGGNMKGIHCARGMKNYSLEHDVKFVMMWVTHSIYHYLSTVFNEPCEETKIGDRSFIWGQ